MGSGPDGTALPKRWIQAKKVLHAFEWTPGAFSAKEVPASEPVYGPEQADGTCTADARRPRRAGGAAPARRIAGGRAISRSRARVRPAHGGGFCAR